MEVRSLPIYMKAALSRTLSTLIIIFCSASVFGQNGVGIGTETPNPNAILDIVSPNGNQGLLVPRLTTAQRTNNNFTGNLSQSDNGLMVFDSDDGHFYFWMNTTWIQVRTGTDIPVGTGLSIVNGEIVNTGDLDATNEIQDLGDVLLTGNDAGGATISNVGDPVNQSDASTKDYVDVLDAADLDKDPTNEIQDLELQGATLRITGNAGASDIDLAPFTGTNTDNQTLSLAGTDLTITGGNSVDLTPIQDGFEANTDNQNLSLSGTSLSISGGNNVNLSSLQDGFEANTDNQDLTLTGTSLAISGGNSVNLASLRDGTGTDDQQLSLSGNNLRLEDGGAVNLSAYLDDTNLTEAEVDAFVSNNGFITSPNDADSSPTNEIQDLQLSGSTLRITNNASATDIDLSPFAGTNTDNQTLSLTGTRLAITGGNNVDLSSIQDGTGTDNQNLRLSGTDLSISGGNTIDVSSLQDGFEANTDNQSLSFAGTSLTIARGNTVNLAGLQDGTGTDNQNLRLSGTDLSISGGNTIDVSSLQDGTGTDNQVLRLSGTDLSISSGNTIDVSSLQDGFEANTDNQDLTLARDILNLSGDATPVSLAGYLDNTDEQQISLSGTDLSITGGNTIDVSSLQDGFEANTDNQDLRLSGNTLSLTGDATSVNLAGFLDNTDRQVLRLTGTDLQISGGNIVDLSPLQSGNSVDVAFKATASNFPLNGPVEPVVFTNEVYDISNSFERLEFRAPVRGIYNFSGVLTGFRDTGFSGTLIITVGGERRQSFTIDTRENEGSFTFSADILLSRDDAVQLVVDTSTGINVLGSTSSSEHRTYFSGRLISEL